MAKAVLFRKTINDFLGCQNLLQTRNCWSGFVSLSLEPAGDQREIGLDFPRRVVALGVDPNIVSSIFVGVFPMNMLGKSVFVF